MIAESPEMAASMPTVGDKGVARRRGLSLRSKGVLAFAGIMIYLAAVVAVTDREHRTHERYVIDIEAVAEAEAEIAKLADALDHAERVLGNAIVGVDGGSVPVAEISRRIETVRSTLAGLQDEFPEMDDRRRQIERGLANLTAKPSHESLTGLWQLVQGSEDRLHVLSDSLIAQRSSLKFNYLEAHARLARIALAHVLLGALVFGVIIFGFLNRLTRDIRATEDVASQVASGFRGPLPRVTRSDELGGLMQSITNMQSELHQHEQKSEVARELHFHKEKMAAVGWMAAAVSHEINNPIAAIAGIARDMLDNGSPDRTQGGEANFGGPRMILAQAERIGAISRQIAEFTSAPVTEPTLFDLNAVVRNTCSFVGYDRRLRGVTLDLDLDPTLPAVFGVADHLTQVLINLVVNAADALEGITGRAPRIRVATGHENDWVTLTVEDNGCGMGASVQARAFEEMFTTKPAGSGRGLGLYMCKSLVERDKGRIGLTSEAGAGTKVRVYLPLQAPDA